MTRPSSWFVPAALAAFLLTTPAFGQAVDEIEIDRPAADLQSALADPVDPADPDAVETALVFTSTGVRTSVHCVARDYQGQRIGGAFTWVPARGLRVIRASDFGPGVMADFVGSASCHSLGAAVGSAFLLGPKGATDLPVRQRRDLISPRKAKHRVFRTHLEFPVVASY